MDLHESILIEILVKLPLKSLITCKLVCKSWHLLISDSTFGKAYNSVEPFKYSLFFNHKSLYLNETDPRKDDKTSSNLNLHLPTNENATLRMVGSCNGLCCFLLEPLGLFDEENIYIYNPLTCEYIEIRDRMKSVSRMSFGFGCGTCTNQYKVVRFLPQVDAQVLGSRIQGRVYTVGVDKRWREFKDPCIPHTTSDEHPVLLDGVLHWVGFEAGPESMMIYAFNVEEEKGKRMELPLALQSSKSQPFIGILNGRLCALGQKRAYFRVWVLEDKGNVKSWTKNVLLRDSIPWYINWWNPGFVCNLATSQHGRKEKMVFTSIGRSKYDSCHDLPYVPCFSSLNILFRGARNVIQLKF
ncbi:F-box/kelch-repeat protein At3g06240-like [Henckelia pumila]|uniref:F-box/kelch-repeat protein At3g06240-like n=1 Tax=Henckelia pumila TaxID=405737 RepID=UPI003C6E5727